jgi:hypothetical protein
MALSNTTLAAACSATDTTITVTSGTGFPAVGVSARSQLVQVNGELMYTVDGVAQPSTGLIKVRSRGAEGTAAAAHDILSPVQTGSDATDWPGIGQGADVPRPPFVDLIITVGQNGVIPVPIQNTTAILNKATALTSTTLAAPSVASNGVRLTLTSATAAAHVLTATSLLADGASGSPHTTATYAAFKGASLVLEACNGLWNVVGNVGVTIT